MKLSVTSWSFTNCSLKEAIGLSKLLGINAIDLGYLHNPALVKKEIINDPAASAEMVYDYDIKVPCLYHLFGSDIKEKNLSLKDKNRKNLKQLEAVTEFCSKASIKTLFVLPGIVNPGQSIQEAMNRSAENLKCMLEVCQEKGIFLAVEPHVGSHLESPELVQELLDKVPGLALILDYAHFVCMGYTQSQIDKLVPYARHVHLRQAKPGELQTDLEGGTINFQTILSKLKASSFDGYLSIEYVHQSYMNSLYDDVLSETIKMRDLVREWEKSPKKQLF